ncbi:hypothetical protein LWI29_014594 [Acer saccharum]|uniref:Uncharacterized protein n=1 Tax=Acer saccharum TaxID=4024 RepID=A0AA39REQ1_ACESA|nr:hypothetical protein LWI29_014594 [Acer saccharum]
MPTAMATVMATDSDSDGEDDNNDLLLILPLSISSLLLSGFMISLLFSGFGDRMIVLLPVSNSRNFRIYGDLLQRKGSSF